MRLKVAGLRLKPPEVGPAESRLATRYCGARLQYGHGIRWGWIGENENPIAAVRTSSKRLRIPETLTVEEFLTLYGRLPDRERAMVTICATTGLRVSETTGLKWGDISFETGLADVQR